MPKFESKSFNLVLMQIIGPALIMAMVASLVFFLIEVFYRGPHAARLYWIMGLFTFASVLVSRVSIQEGKERAFLLGFALAAATFVTCSQLIEFKYAGLSFLSPIVTFGLISTVMWSSSKLTWDCTVVDRSRDPSATGLFDLLQQSVSQDIQSVKDATEKTGLFAKLFSAKPKKNNPGLWVFYFAIMAFPIFGFGQWFVEANHKGWTFVLFAVYLGATLSLLMTTSLLGLERYLSKRKLSVPAPIARNWLVTGGVFALLVMTIVILVPKPPTLGWSSDLAAVFQSTVKDGSKHAPGKDNQKNDPNAQKKRVDKNAKNAPEGDTGNDEKSSAKSKDKGEGKGKGEGDREKDKSAGKDGDAKKGKQQKQSGKQNKPEKQDNEKNPSQRDKSEQNKAKSKNEQPQNRQQQNNKAEKKNQQGKRNQNKDGGRNQQQSSQKFNKLFESLSGVINWIVIFAGVVAVMVLIYMFRQQLFALFKRQSADERESDANPSLEPQKQLPGFSSFQNPFQTGKAKSMQSADLVHYTMSAFEAWSRDLGVKQGPEDTPEELASRVKQIDSGVSKYARLLANLYGKMAFGGNANVSRDELEPLVKLWQKMSAAYANSYNVAAV